MIVRHRLPGLVLILSFLHAIAARSPAQGESADGLAAALRQEVLDLRQKVIEARGQRDALELEKKLLEDARKRLAERTRGQRELILVLAETRINEIRDDLTKTHDARLAELHKLAEHACKIQGEAVTTWREAAKTALELQGEVERMTALRKAEAGKRRVIDVPLMIAIAFGILLALVGYWLLQHERRLIRRHRLRMSSGAVLLAVLLGNAVPAVSAAPPDPEAAERERLGEELSRLKTDLDDLNNQVKKLEQTLEQEHKEALKFWSALLKPLTSEGDSKQADEVRGREEHAMAEVRKLLVANQVTRLVVKEGEEQLSLAIRLREQVSDAVWSEKTGHWGVTLARTSICGVLFLLPMAMLWLLRRGIAKQRKSNLHVCPCCLRKNTLVARKNPKSDPDNPGVRYVICKHQKCQHVFREEYRSVPRLCFPTVGVVGSGKTRWLAVSYWMLHNRKIPEGILLRTAPSTTESQFVEDIIKPIVFEGADPDGTRHKLPHPLTLHLKDNDPEGRSEALVNLFDFSGEITTADITDESRHRALRMEGLLFFLDPCQEAVTPKKLHEQKNALVTFYDHLRDVRKLTVGSQVPLPVAVCVSKIDRLLDDPPMDVFHRDWIGELQNTYGEPPSLDLFRRRSQIVEEQLPTLFSGWNVAAELEQSFGSNVLFFPLSSKGLASHYFGLLEPLMWLLHMHGFQLLPELAQVEQ